MYSQKKEKATPFAKKEMEKNMALIKGIFNGDPGWGTYKNDEYVHIEYAHILKNYKNNLYVDIRDAAPAYFESHNVEWHSGKEHTTSSQVACINHLFPIREDGNAILAILQKIDAGITGVVPLHKDKNGKDVYVAFEVIDEKNHLKELNTPTTIDALLLAKKGETTMLVVIEWKYTECNVEDKSKGPDGTRRKNTYDNFLGGNEPGLKSLKTHNDLSQENIADLYYREPFYQLMRQTLWAKVMIKNGLNNNQISDKNIKIDDYIHIHVVPTGNEELRRVDPNRKYSVYRDLKETWKSHLTNGGKDRYNIIDPKDLFDPIVKDATLSKKYADLIEYLRMRYW